MKKQFAALTLAGLALAGCSSPAPAPTTQPTITTEAAPPPVDNTTPGQKNALRKAESYIDTMPFSRAGLIKQLEFNKFSTEDATWAVDHLTVDWKEQAVKKAKSYLESQAFSRDGLIKQLEFNGFTPEEAEHGVSAQGL